MFDIPYLMGASLGPEVVATMTRVCQEVRSIIPKRIPCGIQVIILIYFLNVICLCTFLCTFLYFDVNFLQLNDLKHLCNRCIFLTFYENMLIKEMK